MNKKASFFFVFLNFLHAFLTITESFIRCSNFFFRVLDNLRQHFILGQLSDLYLQLFSNFYFFHAPLFKDKRIFGHLCYNFIASVEITTFKNISFLSSTIAKKSDRELNYSTNLCAKCRKYLFSNKMRKTLIFVHFELIFSQKKLFYSIFLKTILSTFLAHFEAFFRPISFILVPFFGI